MWKHGNEFDYESLRDARFFENKAWLEMLGLRRTKGELNAIAAAVPPPPLHPQAARHEPAPPLPGLLAKVTAVTVDEEEDNAPAVVEEEMVSALQDSGDHGMGAVYNPVHEEFAIATDAEEIL